jgi:hypothetical protein
MRLIKLNFEIPVEIKIYIYTDLSKKKNLVFKNIKNDTLFFSKIPYNIFFSIKRNGSLLISSFSFLDLNLFVKTLSQQVSILRFPFFLKLFLKGLGFRILLISSANERFLEFKLGFSHSIKLKIPSKAIGVIVKKNSLILSGFSRTDVGNLANRIYNLRVPNVYTGKGFRYKRIPLKLKDVKKT